MANSSLSDYVQARHTSREVAIQRHEWQVQIHPWSLDSGNSCRNDDPVNILIMYSDKVELMVNRYLSFMRVPINSILENWCL